MISENLKKIEVSSSGRPILTNDEVELRIENAVKITQINKAEILPTGTLILTNIQLIHITSTQQTAYSLHLSLVIEIEDCSTFFQKSKDIRVRLSNEIFLLKFCGSSEKEEFSSHIKSALQRKSWIHITPTTATAKIGTQPSIEFSTKNAGIGGIILKQEKTHENNVSLARESLDDIDSLMNRAREVVGVIRKYSAYANKKTDSNSDTTSEKSSVTGDAAELDLILQNIGMVSPVTKQSAGKLYHQQLARQLTDLLLNQSRLERMGGMITLTDAYCVYNRARGTELVSPDDLFEAAKLMGKLQLGISLRTFKTGIMALQLDGYDEESMCHQLVDLARSCDSSCHGIDATYVSNSLNISLSVAKEFLIIAETKGNLCRDESIQGTFFFPNRFLDFPLSSIPLSKNE